MLDITTETRNLPAKNALALFIEKQMSAREWRQRDLVKESGLSRAVVSKYATDSRETLTRLPQRATVEGLSKAFRVPPHVVLDVAIEALGLGYSSGDFINRVETASTEDLLDELRRRIPNAREPME